VPRTLTSGWTVRIATHYLGGGRHYGEWNGWERRWEVADIGVLVMFREAGKLRRTKVALLQSKRLYPDEQEFEEVVKLVESTSTTSPARCPVGGTQISALNSVLPAAVKGCGRFGSIRWRPSTRRDSVSGSVSSQCGRWGWKLNVVTLSSSRGLTTIRITCRVATTASTMSMVAMCPDYPAANKEGKAITRTPESSSISETFDADR
jgi:hypothetical protein